MNTNLNLSLSSIRLDNILKELQIEESLVAETEALIVNQWFYKYLMKDFENIRDWLKNNEELVKKHFSDGLPENSNL